MPAILQFPFLLDLSKYLPAMLFFFKLFVAVGKGSRRVIDKLENN